MPSAAVFFDRDGTLTRDPGYVGHPDQVELLADAAEAVREVRQLGYRTVVVTNQPGVAKGLLTEEMLEQVHERLRELMAGQGATLDAIYYCPCHPDGAVLEYRQDSDWRKPKPGMLLAAADEMDLDLAKSWIVGDSLRDTGAGRSAGCRTILINSGHPGPETTENNKPDYIAVNLREAVNIIKKFHQPGRDGRIVPMFANDSDARTAAELPLQEDAMDQPQEEKPGGNITTEQLLVTILEQIRRTQKTEMFHEFSLLRLLAGVVQVFVPFCLLLALWLLMRSNQPTERVFLALGFGAVLQLMALTFYVMNGRR